MQAFLISTLAVFLAEMGDKSQLLAMAFATRYRWQTVLWGIALATALNHLLAVLAGNLLTSFFPIEWMKLLASLSFLVFGLWTLSNDDTPDTAESPRWSPFWTVCIAFFLVEMGDKTQIMTLSLAANESANAAISNMGDFAHIIVPVWLGTTVGMLLADVIGIVVGIFLHKRIPIGAVKWIAAVSFAVFGFLGLHESLDLLLPGETTWHHGILIGLVPVMVILMVYISRHSRKQQTSI